MRDSLAAAGAGRLAFGEVQHLVWQAETFGFHLAELEVRQHSQVHERALAEIRAGGPRSDLTREVLDTLGVMASLQERYGLDSCRRYVVSFTRSANDIAAVYELARHATGGKVPALDVVPLLETIDDLARASGLMNEMLDLEQVRRRMATSGRRIEVMLGYSDSAKDAGLFPSAWALYRVQEDVARACADAGVSWTLFHGRGGTVGRGGGSPVARALTALPPGTVHGGIKITEQGEIVSQNFGLLSVAERSLELMLSGVLLHRFEDWRNGLEPGEEARFREVMDRLAAEALPSYRTLVYGSGDLFKLFVQTTPVRELADVRFGSRPAYRAPGEETIAGIRAIPWVFGWTQTRLMLPGWLGVGTALEAVGSEPGGLAVLRRMAHAWPFFDDLLAKVEMVCAKADLGIARMYVRELGGDLALFDNLENEFRRTVAALLRIRESDYLMRDNPMLQTAIGLRNPYVDPLSLLQVTLLQRKRDGDPAPGPVSAGLASTLNGIAQGLRNTG